MITPLGLYEFPYMFFGLRKAAQTLQRFIDEVIKDLNFCYAYIDDVLVVSTSENVLEQYLHTLFQRFSGTFSAESSQMCFWSDGSDYSRLNCFS